MKCANLKKNRDSKNWQKIENVNRPNILEEIERAV